MVLTPDMPIYRGYYMGARIRILSSSAESISERYFQHHTDEITT